MDKKKSFKNTLDNRNILSFISRQNNHKINIKGTIGSVFWCLVLSFLFGCGTISQTLNVEAIYNADIRMIINGVTYVGVAQPLKANKYDIQILAPSDMDYFVFRTCHREITSENETDKKRFTYWPQWPIETSDCPAEIEVYSKKAKHAFGLIVFQSDANVLSAKQIKCNGQYIQSPLPVSACQSAEGLLQYIGFEKETILSETGLPIRCKLGEEVSKKSTGFTFSMPQGLCVYTFADMADKTKLHRLYTRGYTSIILRE